MTEKEVQETIRNIPVGGKLQLIKTNGDIIEVVLASHDTSGTDKKDYGKVEVPALKPALIVQGGRWGVYRIDTDEIVQIAQIG